MSEPKRCVFETFFLKGRGALKVKSFKNMG
nr:MAG TPA: hypothetical protein [Caudoviricetes sp.]